MQYSKIKWWEVELKIYTTYCAQLCCLIVELFIEMQDIKI